MGIAPALPSAHAEEKIPPWIQSTAVWWSEGTVSDEEFITALEFLIQEGVIQLPDDLRPISEEKIESYPPSKPITEQPNIIVIMPDDVGWYNIGAYNDGIMAGITPNIDKIAQNGMRFTDYYADPSCTAGRASFITGELPIRTGLTTVGQAGADIGMPAEAPTIATVLKSMGYNTGQFGKNHLGDRDEHLPTNHGFDEFFGNLYHLNAEEEPELPDYPDPKEYPNFRKNFGPRGVIHSYADGKIEDTGPLTKKRMETVDDETVAAAEKFIRNAVKSGKPFFVWWNGTRMHFRTHVKDELKGISGQNEYAERKWQL